MSAGIVASSVLAYKDLGFDAQHSYGILFMTLLLSIVMVSTFRYRSFKDLDLKQRLPFTYLVAGVGVVALIAIRPEVMLFVLFISYALLGAVFGILGWGRQPKGPEPMTATAMGSPEGGDDLHEEVDDEDNPLIR